MDCFRVKWTGRGRGVGMERTGGVKVRKAAHDGKLCFFLCFYVLFSALEEWDGRWGGGVVVVLLLCLLALLFGWTLTLLAQSHLQVCYFSPKKNSEQRRSEPPSTIRNNICVSRGGWGKVKFPSKKRINGENRWDGESIGGCDKTLALFYDFSVPDVMAHQCFTSFFVFCFFWALFAHLAGTPLPPPPPLVFLGCLFFFFLF